LCRISDKKNGTTMDLEGSRIIATDRQTVWRALNDPEVLKACIPGCTEMTGSPEEGFEAVVTQKVGPVKATFRGAVTLTDIVEGESYKLNGSGKGGAAGFAKGGAIVTLADVDGGTKLKYAVEAKMGGKMAQLGSRVINGVATKQAAKFFENFENTVAPAPEEAEAAEENTTNTKPKMGLLAKILSWFKK
jgi:carbon monoxide dehydrogenase subunit G